MPRIEQLFNTPITRRAAIAAGAGGAGLLAGARIARAQEASPEIPTEETPVEEAIDESGLLVAKPADTAEVPPATSEFRYVSPRGFVEINYAPVNYAPGTKVTIDVKPETESQVDKLLEPLNIRWVFNENPNLRPGSGLGLEPGNMVFTSCADLQNRCPNIKIIGYATFAADPQTRIVFNDFNFKEDAQFDQKLSDHIGYLLATETAHQISQIIYGSAIGDIKDDQIRKQAAAVRDNLRDEIKPFQLISR